MRKAGREIPSRPPLRGAGDGLGPSGDLLVAQEDGDVVAQFRRGHDVDPSIAVQVDERGLEPRSRPHGERAIETLRESAPAVSQEDDYAARTAVERDDVLETVSVDVPDRAARDAAGAEGHFVGGA